MGKAERTRAFIIQKSAPLFNIKGYENTSLSDIQEVTKLTKGAIYGNFKDKNELAIASFEYNCSRVFSEIESVLAEACSAKEALLAFSNFYVKNWKNLSASGGCPILNAAVEADDSLTFLKGCVRNNMEYILGLLKSTIEKGICSLEFRSDVHAGEYASLIFSIVEGNILIAKMMNHPKYLSIMDRRIRLIIEKELLR
ncbi:TetR/AcrR family transcriptional regulator [Leadbetterella byssophila]|uniref:TetR/AcrR family transcriptional regulator n=1 Tax=Leadbetterella byssophila TaxID=316068 RepID=UPI00399FD226